MARQTITSTDTQIKANKPKDKDYSLFDGGGMYLKSGDAFIRYDETRYFKK